MKFQELRRTLRTMGVKVTSKSNTLVVKGAETTLENLVETLNKLDNYFAKNSEVEITKQFWNVKEQICTAIADKVEEVKTTESKVKIESVVSGLNNITVKYNKINFVALIELLNSYLTVAK